MKDELRALDALASIAKALKDGTAKKLLDELQAAKAEADKAVEDAGLVGPVAALQAKLQAELDAATRDREFAAAEGARLVAKAKEDAARVYAEAEVRSNELRKAAEAAEGAASAAKAEADALLAAARREMGDARQLKAEGEALRDEFRARLEKLREAGIAVA